MAELLFPEHLTGDERRQRLSAAGEHLGIIMLEKGIAPTPNVLAGFNAELYLGWLLHEEWIRYPAKQTDYSETRLWNANYWRAGNIVYVGLEGIMTCRTQNSAGKPESQLMPEKAERWYEYYDGVLGRHPYPTSDTLLFNSKRIAELVQGVAEMYELVSDISGIIGSIETPTHDPQSESSPQRLPLVARLKKSRLSRLFQRDN